MAATKYQVLYRYINEATNTAITNNMVNSYEPVREFYTDPDHKIFSPDLIVQAEATDEQQEMISFGNSSDNPKTNMLFAYDGTKKIKHKKWVNDTTGYIVRDWQQLRRDNIGNQGDFSKEFTTLNAATPEDGGIVVCTADVFKKYFTGTITVAVDNSLADAGSGQNRYYTENKMNKLVTDSTIFKLNTFGYQDHAAASLSRSVWTEGPSYSKHYITIYTGPIAIGGNNMSYHNYPTGDSAYGQTNDTCLYSKVTITEEQIATTIIPGHYEDALNAPYLIIDTYKRIQLSPWFVNYTCSSLESALTRVRTLVDMIGVENVKLIKIVPFDQFVKVK